MCLQLDALLPLCTILVTVLACSNNSGEPAFPNGSGGQVGGSSSAAGGATSTNSSSSGASTGGSLASTNGGAGSTSSTSTSMGGTNATGGTSTIPNGGASNGGATGGSSTTAKGAAGGGQSKGGNGGAAGGTSGKGGGSNTGGSVATGGTEAIGGASACSWTSAPSSDSGRLTCYWFSQGTGNNFRECPGKYKTACGYCGTETGKKDQTNNNPCAIGEVTDNVENTPTTYFAAFPAGAYAGNNYCGMCVEVTYRNKTITATIVDNCASCSQTGHLDLSLAAAEALGMGGMIGDLTLGVAWKAVACPATDNIYVLYNGGLQTNQAYFQNLAFPIASVEYDGKRASEISAFWSFDSEMSGKTVTLTDIAGHTIQGTMPSTLPGGSLGVQFPLTCQ